MAALNAWSPKSLIKYVRKLSRDTYYNDMVNNGQNNGDADSDGSVDVQMGDKTTRRSGYDLRKTSNIPTGTGQLLKKEGRFTDSDLMDGVSALWTKTPLVKLEFK